MAGKPVTITGAATIAEALAILLETGFTALPVIHDGAICLFPDPT